MISFAGIGIMGFIKFLNSKELTYQPCELTYLPEHCSVNAVDEGGNILDRGSVCYNPLSRVIYVAGDIENTEEAEIIRLGSLDFEYLYHVEIVEGSEVLIMCEWLYKLIDRIDIFISVIKGNTLRIYRKQVEVGEDHLMRMESRVMDILIEDSKVTSGGYKYERYS